MALPADLGIYRQELVSTPRVTTPLMITTTVPTIHPSTTVPADHRTAFVDDDDTLLLYGFRGNNGTARYTLIHDGWRNGDGTDVIAANIEWSAAWRLLVARGWSCKLPELLRSVLP